MSDPEFQGGACPRQAVWIFHGEGAPFASGVFTSRAQGLEWAERHGGSGILTEYPVGDGCYDIAVSEQRFRPSKPHHGTPEHIAKFAPGWTTHVIPRANAQ
jgi:hypothetical protein